MERRSDGLCEFCRQHRATQKIHLEVPHARGGSREADNIGDACGDCHFMVDARIMIFTGFDDEGRLTWEWNRRRLNELRGDSPQVRERAPCYAGSEVQSGEIFSGEVAVPYG